MKKSISGFILLIFFIVACSTNESTIKAPIGTVITQTQATASYLTPIPIDTLIPTMSRTPAPKETSIPPTVIPWPLITPNSDGTNRDNPIEIHAQLGLTMDYEQEFTITFLEVKRGKDAWKDIYGINIYNPRAPADKEYVLANIELNYTKGPTGKTLQIDPFEFGSVTNNVVLPIQLVVLDPDFFKKFSKGLAVGDKAYGLVAFLVFKDDPNPLIYFGNPSGENVWYFSTNKIKNING